MFSGCTSLSDVYIGELVSTVGLRAFSGCVSLESLDFPYVSSLKNYITQGCDSLLSVSIGSSIQSIANRAFYSTPSITRISIGGLKDSIAGSPWGAANAEIIWTGDEN